MPYKKKKEPRGKRGKEKEMAASRNQHEHKLFQGKTLRRFWEKNRRPECNEMAIVGLAKCRRQKGKRGPLAEGQS